LCVAGIGLPRGSNAQAKAQTRAETMVVAGFGTVTIYAPPGTPTEVVLFISGDGGWNLGVVSMAERLRGMGALVVGIDIRSFFKSLESGKSCPYPAGALEELSRTVQIQRKLASYIRPILVGYSSGATMVYAALAAAPEETFAGGVSLGFCSDIEMHASPCAMRGLQPSKLPKRVGYDLAAFPGLAVPWMVLHGAQDQVCDPDATRAFVARIPMARLFALPKVGHGFGVPANWNAQFVEAFRAVSRARAATATAMAPLPVGSGLSGLSLVEVPATGGGDRERIAIVLSGDGGWAELDKRVAAGRSALGVPAIGWSSLEYYWTPRTPERAADDLGRIMAHYLPAWGRQKVILVGYSFGADVLPFLVARLPAALRERVERVALLGLSETASFEFHLSSWIGRGGQTSYRTTAEIARLSMPVTCVQGEDETDSACRAIKSPNVTVVTIGRGHHFSGLYARLVDAILK
jgi:type IV secretory pathway VirJ component